jgi:Holliday junction resolvase
MPFKSKVKGSTFERDLTDLLNQHIVKSLWKRIPMSGAIGTFLSEPELQGDVKGSVDSFNKQFRIEAKVGYGGKTQLTLKKEWLDKIIEDSKNSNSIPLMGGKFSGAREGIKVFVAMDLGTFCEIINRTTELYEDLHEEAEKYERREMERS